MKSKLTTAILLGTMTLAFSGCSYFSRKEKTPDRPATPLEQPQTGVVPDAPTIPEDGYAPEASATPAAPVAPDGSWSFDGDLGPEKWGSLKPEYLTCSEGKEQSPVDLIFKKPKTGGAIKTAYGPSSVRVIDNGHTIQINFDPGNSVNIRGKDFDLLYVQFKSSSEHTIAGNKLPMEAQLTHRSESGEMAVLSVILIEGKSHSLVESIWQNIPIQKGMEKDLNFKINPEDLLPKVRTYYHYTGSLTTPPCTEGVNWNVFNTPVTLSKEQIISFRGLYKNNSRPVQSLNARKTVNYK